MVSRLRSRLGLAVGILGLVLAFTTVFLPTLKVHQTAVNTGPTSPYGNSTSTFSVFLIPTVDEGSTLKIAVTGYSPDSLSLSLFSTQEGDFNPIGSPLVSLANFTKPVTRITVVSPATQAYGIFIFSGNKTQFVLAVDGTWSSYYALRAYTPEAMFVAVVGFLAFFYFRQWERRKMVEEQATKEAEGGGRSVVPSGVRILPPDRAQEFRGPQRGLPYRAEVSA